MEKIHIQGEKIPSLRFGRPVDKKLSLLGAFKGPDEICMEDVVYKLRRWVAFPYGFHYLVTGLIHRRLEVTSGEQCAKIIMEAVMIVRFQGASMPARMAFKKDGVTSPIWTWFIGASLGVCRHLGVTQGGVGAMTF
jgi:hypothetical protein